MCLSLWEHVMYVSSCRVTVTSVINMMFFNHTQQVHIQVGCDTMDLNDLPWMIFHESVYRIFLT